MTTFSSRNQSTAVVPAERSRIWKLLADPAALARLTPLVKGIKADGDDWCWRLSGISALGVTVEPSFLERMAFTPEEKIEFAPAADGERAGAVGTYLLRDVDGGTHLSIDITIRADLPLPRAARRAVEKVMASVMEKTGDRFARNLCAELGLAPTWERSAA